MIKMSSGLLRKDNTLIGMRDLFNANDGHIGIYSGCAPKSADDAVTGTLLCVLRQKGGSLRFEERNGKLCPRGIKVYPHLSTLSFTERLKYLFTGEFPFRLDFDIKGFAINIGTASYFRYVFNHESCEKSSDAVRIQGSVGTSPGADMVFCSTSIVVGQLCILDVFKFSNENWA